MIMQLSRNLRSQHLLIFIMAIILAMIATSLHNHADNSTLISEFHSNYHSDIGFNIPLIIQKEPTTVSPQMTIPSQKLDASASPLTSTLTPSNVTPTAPIPLTPLTSTAISTKTIPPLTTAQNISPSHDNKLFSPGWQTVTIHSGDNLSHIFIKLGISYNDLEKILHLPLAKNKFSHLNIGQQLEILINSKHQLQQIKYAFNDIDTLIISPTGNKFTASVHSKPLKSQTLFKEFSIHGSIISSMGRAGLTSGLYSELHQILHSSLNFNTGIHAGDRFSILYQEYYIHDRKYKPGHIMLVNFNGQHKHLTAVRYTDPKGHSHYYTPTGQGLEAMFLAAPLQYKYISSYFSLHRLDPYLHRYHPHLGVDYAAAKGTPIHSIGDGVVAYRGWSIGYGNTIIIKYNGIYKALYGHLSRFANNLRTGEYINKGQVIGYVGSTGWATGDHLHFGWFVNGIPKDPLKYTADATAPIPAEYRHAFLAQTKQLLNQLELGKNTAFAENKTNAIAR